MNEYVDCPECSTYHPAYVCATCKGERKIKTPECPAEYSDFELGEQISYLDYGCNYYVRSQPRYVEHGFQKWEIDISFGEKGKIQQAHPAHIKHLWCRKERRIAELEASNERLAAEASCADGVYPILEAVEAERDRAKQSLAAIIALLDGQGEMVERLTTLGERRLWFTEFLTVKDGKAISEDLPALLALVGDIRKVAEGVRE